MQRNKSRFGSFLLIAIVLVVPATALAQNESSISGVVTDPTAGVLPGTSVEVASPALIEQSRIAVTDGRGRYLISGLRPGVYSVTFTLPGFSRVIRDGIELTGSFTATVNAVLTVGTVEETITVTGESPVVDVQNILVRNVVSHELIDNLPTGKVSHQLAALMPGVTVGFSSQTYQGTRTQDVGGSSGETLGDGVLAHGSRAVDNLIMIDGMRINGASMSGGGGHGMKGNPGSALEIVIETSGVSAEHELGGVRVNVIPKEGGNSYSGYFAADFTNAALYSENLSDNLLSRGIDSVNKVERVTSFNPVVGGPLMRDKLWFNLGVSYRFARRASADVYYDTDPLDWVYVADENRPVFADNWGTDNNLRLTWQASPRNKINGYYAVGYVCYCMNGLSPTNTYANSRIYTYTPNSLLQASWTSPVTSRLLLEAGVSRPLIDTHQAAQDDIGVDAIGVNETSTGVTFRGRSSPYTRKSRQWNTHTRFSASYVTGSHAFKAGFTTATGGRDVGYIFNRESLFYRMTNGVPNRITQHINPRFYTVNMRLNLGLYVQDRWTIDRLSLNLGARLDFLNGFYRDQVLDSSRFTAATSFPGRDGTPAWKDFSPRIGAAYDLFGDGKTALKGHLGYFVVGTQTGISQATNPVASTIVTSANRNWSDANGDFVADCDFTVNEANGECGSISNTGFGTSRVTRTFDDDYLAGWGKRAGNWEGSIGVQHEVVPGVALDVGFFRRSYTNFSATQNLLVNGSNYDPYCVSVVQDARLPGGGGNELCGLFDIDPAFRGRSERFTTNVEQFGKQIEVYKGIDVNVNGRFADGVLIGGGLSTGSILRDNCEVVAALGIGAFGRQSGPATNFCRTDPPWQTEIKVHFVVPLPAGLSVSGNFQSIPGPQILARWSAPNSAIAPSLGRNLASGANGRATVQLIEPGSLYEERFQQLDVRLAKRFTVGNTRIQGMFDVYNAFNSSAILGVNSSFSPGSSSWLRPTAVITGRLMKIGIQMDF